MSNKYIDLSDIDLSDDELATANGGAVPSALGPQLVPVSILKPIGSGPISDSIGVGVGCVSWSKDYNVVALPVSGLR